MIVVLAKGSMHVLWDGSALEEVLGECCAAPAGILGKGMQLATVANHCILDTGERS